MSGSPYGSNERVTTYASPASSGSGDGADDGAGQGGAPNGEVSRSPPARSDREAFRQQVNDELWRAAHRYARRRAALVRRAGARVDYLYSQELVENALGDTWIGTQVTWDPTECSLRERIRCLIRSRSWNDRVAAERRPHVSFDWDDEEIAVEIEESNRRGASSSVSPLAFGNILTAVINELQQLASGDEEVLAILAAWQAGLADRDDVMASTGLSAQAYRKARQRVTYLVQKLPQSLRDGATTLLRSGS